MNLGILKIDFLTLIQNPFVLLFVSIFLGNLVGKIQIKKISLGSSGSLFVGLFLSWALMSVLLQLPELELDAASRFVPSVLFNLSLILFISAVGLKASKNIRPAIQEYGFKFIILAFVVTGSGALSTFFFTRIFSNQSLASVVGTFSGALTSSPGLASAIEAALLKGSSDELVGLGYSISYIPGVVIVILFVQLLAKYYRSKGLLSDVLKTAQSESACGEKTFLPENSQHQSHKIITQTFSISGYVLVCFAGIAFGNIQVYLGNTIGFFSLGATGGVLLSSLFFGDRKHLGRLNFNYDDTVLNALRDLGLNLFLAIVGINYGYAAISAVAESGFTLLLIGTATALISILSGFFVGHRILKIKPVYLIGGLCGGMTSTPGLAAGIDTIKSDEIGVSYGATYPFALFFMILFINILFKFA